MGINRSDLRRRLRLLLRRLNVFDPARTADMPQGNVSGPPDPGKPGPRG